MPDKEYAHQLLGQLALAPLVAVVHLIETMVPVEKGGHSEHR